MRSFRLFRANRDFDVAQLRLMNDVIARSRELLQRHPVPDTFLGRKTQEPFPREEKKARN
jgi:hypothetical protein